MKFNNILAIGAHPDDIEYGCLGFLKKQSSKGAFIHIHVLSLGSLGDSSANVGRISETRNGLAVLQPASFNVREEIGINETDFHDLLKEIESTIDRTNPDLILVHGPNDTHQQHIHVHRMVMAAARRRKISVLQYAIVSNDLNFRPNFFVELTPDEIELKIEQLGHHISQRDKFYMQSDYIKKFHQRPYTLIHDMEYCEAFETNRIILSA
ncbi:MAG: PIG-L deacetylase family protein [Bacteroidota bacterium]